jgi:predicted hydrocarbon binding protein
MVELPEEWTPERKWKAAERARARYVGELERAMVEKWGEEAVQLIGKVWADAAERTLERGLRTFGIEGRDARALARFFVLSNSVLGLNMELVEESEKRAVWRINPPCHVFGGDPSGVPSAICREGHGSFEVKAAQLLNPRLKVTCTQVQSEGAPYCEWVAELED